jgi:UDP-N-acetylglucosamine 2-epimerase (non-hydrolysing)
MISDAVLTDSGGIQEESVTLGKRVLVLRDKTERAEGMTSGLLSLVGANAERIVEEFNRVDSFIPGKDSSTQLNFIYGDGEAAKRISEVIRTGETVEWSPKAQ